MRILISRNVFPPTSQRLPARPRVLPGPSVSGYNFRFFNLACGLRRRGSPIRQCARSYCPVCLLTLSFFFIFGGSFFFLLAILPENSVRKRHRTAKNCTMKIFSLFLPAVLPDWDLPLFHFGQQDNLKDFFCVVFFSS